MFAMYMWQDLTCIDWQGSGLACLEMLEQDLWVAKWVEFGCRIARSVARTLLTTDASIHLSFRCTAMSAGVMSNHMSG